MGFFEGLVGQIKVILNGLTNGQKLVLLSMVAAFIVSGLVFSKWVGKPEMTVLTSGADMARAGEIVKVLESKGVEYRVTHGGRTIMVDGDQVSEIAVSLAAEGLVGDSPGGRVLDSKNVGMWPTPVLRDNLRRVLQGELGRMISGLQSVESAQVQLALPEESVFVEDSKQPTASVLIRMAGGRTLSQNQIRGIANLVSSGVEGLEPGRVSVVDSEGKVLWGDATETDEATTARLQKKKEIERHLSDKANRMLWRVVGEGRAAVSVNADLSWKQTETTTRKFDPERSSVRSEQRDESSEGENSTESSVTNYEIDETTQFISSKGAELEKLTVSVAVDHRRVVDSQGAVTYERIPAEEIDQLRNMVMDAVGYNETRGDRITVINQRFTDPEPIKDSGGFFSSSLFQMVPSFLGKLVAVVIALMLVLAVKKQMTNPAPLRAGSDGRLMSGIPVLDGVPGDGRRVSAQDRFQSIAQGNPENVARVMKSWMSE
jgi:flagellar M-ring protein FliF